jgi:hypothetical protein
MADELMRALIDARDLAMKNTVAARVPECGDFGAIAQNLDWVVAELESRAAPIAAQLDAEGLPPLPAENFCAWMNGDRASSAFTHAVGDPAIWDKGGYWSSKGYRRAPLYTAEQVRQAQRDAVAAYIDGRTAGIAVPKGYVLVPLDPDEKMLGVLQWFDRGSPAQIKAGWAKVLAAAPSPQSPAGGEGQA